ncbi:Aminopeptidase YwaD precursor [Mariniflexile rhizosphaerae]|uniref:M28 family metallopeptidase n=1 Tax=unclassified Mariniflexile TaxID=2643887 RepID=UPI000CB38AE8|nr:M20/M25/M40 family metallo-hydrolase [Mariniflexile sp. TRM1-10]AXP80706.1 Aminopeptidase YwaD precursor [Mariniflexile sp. TRM1-10]PLB19776.1 MAG: putative aminopeptidase [Flavobacteriaceae bacterium FS1-H7996/R]
MKKVFLGLLLIANCFSLFSQSDITKHEIKEHIKFLTSRKNEGRYPGGKTNKRVVKYLEKDFKKSGIESFKGGYKQHFKARLRAEEGVAEKPLVSTWNVIGFIEGNDAILKNEYIILGAHYDHLGLGGPSSKSDKKHTIHFGADDNASGTAALLEIAEKLVGYKLELKRSIIFIAFGAEEQGLLGSEYFVEHPIVPLEQMKLMINMDMVGRLNEEKQVYMGGAGTFPGGVDFMTHLGKSLGLNPVVHAGSVGGSDHVSFYKKGISVMGMHTGGHPQYHTPEDTLELINLEGEKMVCEYIFQTIMRIASTNKELYFIKQND